MFFPVSPVSLNILLVFCNVRLSNKRQSLGDIIIIQEVTSFLWDNRNTKISKFLGFYEINLLK